MRIFSAANDSSIPGLASLLIPPKIKNLLINPSFFEASKLAKIMD